MNRQKEIFKYIISDFLASAVAWTLFFIYRKIFVDSATLGYKIPVKFDQNFYLAILLVPLFWVIMYAIFGTYKGIYRKSRIMEFGKTFLITFVGTVILFFLLLLDDWVNSYIYYRYTFLALFSLQFILLFTTRFILLTRLKNKLKKGETGFHTVMVGSDQKALDLYRELENSNPREGYKFIGFVTIENQKEPPLSKHLSCLGNYENLPDLILEYQVEEVIIALESSEHDKLEKIITLLEDQDIVIKILPDIYDIITGMVKTSYIFGTALMEINPSLMPQSQKNLKRILDITVSSVILSILTPLFLLIALMIKLNSRGPVFFKQNRVGQKSNPFFIYKFRTMKENAEDDGPQLSSENDPRVTSVGRILRKYRLDELPQFFNVLKGDMSLVGPRPERRYYIDEIVKVAPHYKHLLRVKPGITSWGQVKYGYAENVEEMVNRLKFDILYIENMSLGMDLKILFYTVLTILKGSGK